jgi:hypothetical protein
MLFDIFSPNIPHSMIAVTRILHVQSRELILDQLAHKTDSVRLGVP